VQEALTNAVRHAHASRVRVRIAGQDGDLVIVVDDDGDEPPGDPAAGRTGSGIRGMTERAAALGGQLVAGPKPGGGFAVLARLPLGAR
jgi:signal transduction histidine kinase